MVTSKALASIKDKNKQNMETIKLIIISVLLVGFIISVPYLKKFKLFQFTTLLVLSFTTGILMANSIQEKGWEYRNMTLFVLLIVGIIYQAFKFYNENLRNTIWFISNIKNVTEANMQIRLMLGLPGSPSYPISIRTSLICKAL